MSAKNRAGKESDPFDDYPSPIWTVQSFLDMYVREQGHVHKGVWLEPCAGTGNIIKGASDFPYDCGAIAWDAVELQDKYEPALSGLELTPPVTIFCPDNFLEVSKNPLHPVGMGNKYAAVMTNPPYTLALDFILSSMNLSDVVIMLLRVNFSGSVERHEFFKTAKEPDKYILKPRPRFRFKGSDACEYAWFVWAPHTTGTTYHLEVGPVARKFPRKVDVPASHRR